MYQGRLSLTTAEYSLLMTAIPVQPRPFTSDGQGGRVDSTVFYRRLESARQSVLERRLATLRDDNTLAVAEPVRDLIVHALTLQTGFQLAHLWTGKTLQRAFFGLDEQTITLEHVDGDRFHHLEALPDANTVLIHTAIIAGIDSLPRGADLPERSYVVPAKVYDELATMPPVVGQDLAEVLRAHELGDGDVAALLKAGGRPLHQSTFTLAGDAAAGRLPGVTWFGDQDSHWLVSGITPGERVVLMPATANSVRAVLRALVTRVLGG